MKNKTLHTVGHAVKLIYIQGKYANKQGIHQLHQATEGQTESTYLNSIWVERI